MQNAGQQRNNFPPRGGTGPHSVRAKQSQWHLGDYRANLIPLIMASPAITNELPQMKSDIW